VYFFENKCSLIALAMLNSISCSLVSDSLYTGPVNSKSSFGLFPKKRKFPLVAKKSYNLSSGLYTILKYTSMRL
jgi:hypothetical protein